MLALKRALGCQRSYCAWRALPMFSIALAGCIENGSIQHSSLAHGLVLTTSGGSTPMLRHTTRATLPVFIRSCRAQNWLSKEGVDNTADILLLSISPPGSSMKTLAWSSSRATCPRGTTVPCPANTNRRAHPSRLFHSPCCNFYEPPTSSTTETLLVLVVIVVAAVCPVVRADRSCPGR